MLLVVSCLRPKQLTTKKDNKKAAAFAATFFITSY